MATRSIESVLSNGDALFESEVGYELLGAFVDIIERFKKTQAQMACIPDNCAFHVTITV